MLNRLQAAYRYLKAEKARSDALVEEGRQMMGWRSAASLRASRQTPAPADANSPLTLQLD
jgi:hypothetical protein